MARPCNPLSDYPCDIDRATGACIYCGWSFCATCDRPFALEALSEVHWVPGEHAPGRLCGECLAADDDSDGVPVEVPEEGTGAQTVRQATPTDAELVAEREALRAEQDADLVTFDLEPPAALPRFRPEWERQLNARGFSRFSRGAE